MWVKNEGATTHPTHCGRVGRVRSGRRTERNNRKPKKSLPVVTTEGGEKYLCVSTDTTILEGGEEEEGRGSYCHSQALSGANQRNVSRRAY